MRPDYCLLIFQVTILAALFFTAEADSEDSNCELQIKVHRHTLYEGFPGKELRINCTVVFCSSSPPEVSWFKVEKTAPPSPLNVSSNSRIKTEWKSLKDLGGTSHLIFQNALISDSGVYVCRSGGSVSHYINVTVNGDDEPTTVTSDPTPVTSELTGSAVQDYGWPYVYRAAGFILFIIVIAMMCVVSKSGCKGACCAGKSGDSQDPRRPSHDALPAFHIYENDQ